MPGAVCRIVARPVKRARAPLWVALATLSLTALVWSLSVVSFLDVKNLALWCGCIALWVAQRRAGSAGASGFRYLLPCWLGLGTAMVFGLAWAPVPAFTGTEGLRIAGMMLFVSLAFPLLRGRRAERQVLGIVAGTGIACAVLALIQWGGGLTGLFPSFPHYDQPMYSVFGNQGLLGAYLATALVALLGMPAVASRVVMGTRVAAGVFLFAVLLMSLSRGALLACVAGLFFLIVARAPSRRTLPVIAGVMLLGGLVAVAVDGSGLAERWGGIGRSGDVGVTIRPWIWSGTLDLIRAHPLFGVGLGNFVYAAPAFLGPRTPPELAGVASNTTYHAHADLLEATAEIGVAGIVFLLWMAARIHLRAPRAAACLVVLMVFGMFHPAWHSTPHGLLMIVFVAMNVRVRRAGWSRVWNRRIHGMAGVAAAAGGILFVSAVLSPSFLLRRAEDLHLAGQAAGPAYESAIGAFGHTPESHQSYGVHAFDHGDFVLASRQFELARAGLDTGRIYYLLGAAAEARGAREEACDWYRQCALRWPYYPALPQSLSRVCVDGTEGRPPGVNPRRPPASAVTGSQ